MEQGLVEPLMILFLSQDCEKSWNVELVDSVSFAFSRDHFDVMKRIRRSEARREASSR